MRRIVCKMEKNLRDLILYENILRKGNRIEKKVLYINYNLKL